MADTTDPWASIAQDSASDQWNQIKADAQSAPPGSSQQDGYAIQKAAPGSATQITELPQQSPNRVISGSGNQVQSTRADDPWQQIAAQSQFSSAAAAGQNVVPQLRALQRSGAPMAPTPGPDDNIAPAAQQPPSTPFGRLMQSDQAHKGIVSGAVEDDMYARDGWAHQYGQALVDQNNQKFQEWAQANGKDQNDPYAAADFLKMMLPADQRMKQEARFKAEKVFVDALTARNELAQGLIHQFQANNPGQTDDMKILAAVHQQMQQLGIPDSGKLPPITIKQGQVVQDVGEAHGVMDAFLKGAGGLVYKPAELLEGLAQGVSDKLTRGRGASAGPSMFQQARQATAGYEQQGADMLPESTTAATDPGWRGALQRSAEGVAGAVPAIGAAVATAGGSQAPGLLQLGAGFSTTKAVGTIINSVLFGMQAGGASYQAIYKSAKDQGLNDVQASSAASVGGVIDGAVSAYLMRFGAIGGMERASVRSYLGSIVKTAAAQGGVGAAQRLVSEFNKYATTGASPDVEAILKDGVSQALAGGLTAAAHPAGIKAAYRDFTGATTEAGREAAAESASKAWGSKGGGMSDAEARQWLGLDPRKPIDADDLTAAWRDKVQDVHPDRGGTQADFQKTTAARAVLRANLGQKGSGEVPPPPQQTAPQPPVAPEHAAGGNGEPQPRAPEATNVQNPPASNVPAAGAPQEAVAPQPPANKPGQGPGAEGNNGLEQGAGVGGDTTPHAQGEPSHPNPLVAKALDNIQQRAEVEHGGIVPTEGERRALDAFDRRVHDAGAGEGDRRSPGERRLPAQSHAVQADEPPHPALVEHPHELANAHEVGQWYARTFDDPRGADAIETLASMAGDQKYVRADVDPSKIDPSAVQAGDTDHAKVQAVSELPDVARKALPPVIAVPLGDGLTVADGSHRVQGAVKAGWKSIEAYVPESFIGKPGISRHGEKALTKAPAKSEAKPPAEFTEGIKSGIKAQEPAQAVPTDTAILEDHQKLTDLRGQLQRGELAGDEKAAAEKTVDHLAATIQEQVERYSGHHGEDAGEDLLEKMAAVAQTPPAAHSGDHVNSNQVGRRGSSDVQGPVQEGRRSGSPEQGRRGGRRDGHEGQEGDDQGPRPDASALIHLGPDGPWDFRNSFPFDSKNGSGASIREAHETLIPQLVLDLKRAHTAQEGLQTSIGPEGRRLSIKARQNLRADEEAIYKRIRAAMEGYGEAFGDKARLALWKHINDLAGPENTNTAVSKPGIINPEEASHEQPTPESGDPGQTPGEHDAVLPGSDQGSAAPRSAGRAGQGDVEAGTPQTARGAEGIGDAGTGGAAGSGELPGSLRPDGGERGERGDGGRGGGGPVLRTDADRAANPAGPGSGAGDSGGSVSQADGAREPGESLPASLAGNFVIRDPAAIESGGARTKFKRNVAAIELLRKIQGEGRDRATPDEQAVLALFSGWGQFPQVFNDYGNHSGEDAQKWADERVILKGLIGEGAPWEAAKKSTINAHYTSPEMVQQIYQALTTMGFDGGRLLEPSMGAGIFFGLLPGSLRGKSRLTGVELDPTTAAIARLVYPDANIQAKGFQDLKVPDGFFDAAVGNVPFGDIRIHDPAYNKYAAPIHDYFFLKSLDKVRPGGLVAFITSTGTLDKMSGGKIRQAIAERGELVTAIRLPEGAFAKSAGTQVVTDLLILRRLNEGEKPTGESFVGMGPLPNADGGDPIDVNEYYTRHPENILGRLDTKSRLYGKGDMHVSRTDDFEQRLAKWQEGIPAGIYQPAPPRQFTKARRLVQPTAKAKDGAYVKEGKKLYRNVGGELVEADVDPKNAAIVSDILKVRDALREVINAQLEGKGEKQTVAARGRLNEEYDRFVKKHGALTKKKNAAAFADDPDRELVLALEKSYDPKTQVAAKADVFIKNTIRGEKKTEKVPDVASALPIVLNETGKLDLDRVAEITGKTPQEAGNDLVKAGLGYKDPAGGWMTREQYLSGNVRKRLVEAMDAAAAEPEYRPNVVALEKVQPPDVDYDQIGVRAGSAWLPASDIKQFAADLIGGIPEHFDVKYLATNGSWIANYTSTGANRHSGSPQDRQLYGTPDASFPDVLDHALNGKIFNITKPGPTKDSRVQDVEATAAANGKVKDLVRKFAEWVWEDDQRRQRLHRLYNDTFNNVVPVKYDGSHLSFPGMNPEITLRPHQINSVWRIICTGRALLGHEVGTGKTYTMVAAAMELRRLGLANKPAIAGPKKNQATIIKQAKALYPAIRIHVVEDFDAKGRKEAVSRIATGDFDLIVMTHDHLNMLPMAPEVEQEFIQKELDELEQVKRSIEDEGEPQPAYGRRRAKSKSDNKMVKQLEKIKARLEERLKEALDSKKDNAVTFEQTGIDQLFVDEAHAYKSLPVYTKHERVKGIPSSRSDRATNMWMRTQWLQKMNNGRGVVFATGTPVTNTMTELYTMQRYLQMKDLEERGIAAFDAWASTFGQMNTKTEYSVAGEYKPVTRFNSFINLHELQRISGQAIDVQRAKNMADFDRPKRKDAVVKVPMSAEQRQYMGVINERAQAAKHKRPGDKGDNMLSISTDARKSSIDHRLIDPAADMAGGKVDKIAENVIAILKDNPGTTQMIFSDFGLHPTERNKFTFFGALTEKLVAGGIPLDRIVNFTTLTDAAEKSAADKLNSGAAIIGLASSSAGGTGINAQQHLIALHHADVPWVPALVEQRDGRGWRQGNLNKVVHMFRYVTEGGFDTFMWQAVDAKTRFIQQFMDGDGVARSITEEDGEELTPAQVMAISSGDPLLLDRINLEAEIKEYDSAAQRHARQELKLRDTAVELRKSIAATDKKEGMLKEAVKAASARKDDKFEMTISGKSYTEREAAQNALDKLVETAPATKPGQPPVPIGEYRGFPMSLHKTWSGSSAVLSVGGVDVFPTASTGSIEHHARPGYWEARLGEVLSNRKVWKADLEKLEKQMGKPFPHKAVLAQKKMALEELQGKLASKAEKMPAPQEGGGAGGAGGEGGNYTAASATATSAGPTASPVIRKSEGGEFAGRQPLRPIAMPELLKLATELMDGRQPLIRKLPKSSALFSAKGQFGQIRIDPRRVRGAFEMAKVLAHELGHLEDWLPDHTLARRGLIRRVHKLTQGQIIRKLKAVNAQVKAIFGSVKIANRELKDELVGLSEWWTHYDKANARPSYIAYRESPRELYAEALSVLLNAPGEVEARAPKFYKAFGDALDRHAGFKDAYFNLQDLLAGTPEQIAAARRLDIREAYHKGEEILKARAMERMAAAFGNPLTAIRQILLDRQTPALMIQKKAEKSAGGQAMDESTNAKWAYSELTYADNAGHLWLKKVESQIHDALETAGLTPEDMGEYLQMVRTESERADMANPQGHTPATAAQMKADMEKAMGPTKWAELQRITTAFHDLVHEVTEEARDVGYYSEKTFKEVIEPNKYRYATFAVLDHLQDSIAPGIMQQVGTFKDVANPYTATMLKSLSLIRAVQLQKARVPLIKLLKQEKEIPAKGEFRTGEGGRRSEPGKPPAGKEWMIHYEDGHPVWYPVDRYLAKVFANHDIGMLNALGKVITRATYRTLHPLYVGFNLGWHLRLIPRDMVRVYRNSGFKGNPSTVGEILKAYWKALPTAYRYAAQKDDPLIEQMLEDKALAVPFQQWDFNDEHDTFERQLDRAGLGERKEPANKALAIAQKILHAIEAAGSMLIATPKVAGWHLVTARGIDGPERAYRVRNFFGHPDRKRRGLGTNLTNGVAMYSNILIQFLRADAEAATDPKTKTAWWVRTLLTSVLPKLLLAAGAGGLLGEWLKKMLEAVPESDKSKYIIIPLYMSSSDDGKTRKPVYVRIPQDPLGGLVGAITWKLMHRDGQPAMATISQALDVPYADGPHMNPYIQSAANWADYLHGQNPWDSFRQRNIVPEQDWKAGGWYRARDMIQWQLNQLGILSTLGHSLVGKTGQRETTTETVLGSIPGGFVVSSDRGIQEKEELAAALDDAEKARFHLGLGDDTLKAVRERYRLGLIKAHDDNDEDRIRRAQYNQWYSRLYLPLTRAIKAADDRGDEAEGKRLRAQLNESAGGIGK